MLDLSIWDNAWKSLLPWGFYASENSKVQISVGFALEENLAACIPTALLNNQGQTWNVAEILREIWLQAQEFEILLLLWGRDRWVFYGCDLGLSWERFFQ